MTFVFVFDMTGENKLPGVFHPENRKGLHTGHFSDGAGLSHRLETREPAWATSCLQQGQGPSLRLIGSIWLKLIY